jgi:hypothetical protein
MIVTMADALFVLHDWQRTLADVTRPRARHGGQRQDSGAWPAVVDSCIVLPPLRITCMATAIARWSTLSPKLLLLSRLFCVTQRVAHQTTGLQPPN